MVTSLSRNRIVYSYNFKNIFFRFSVVRESDGAVTSVLYTSDEPLTVLAFKKTLAALLSVDTSSSSWSEDGSSMVLVQEKVEGGKGYSKSTTIDRASGAVVEVIMTENSGRGEAISEFKT